MTDFLKQARRFETWVRDHALPLWAEAAYDQRGGFAEQLLITGEPDNTAPRRVRVQARLSYVYAHAHTLGWWDGAKSASNHAWDYLTTNGFDGGDFIPGKGPKGCAHLLNPDGTILDPARDTYAQAFVLLAGAWRYRAFGDESALQTADDTISFLNADVRADNGGWLEGLPPSLPRRQNPHMHLFEAFIALHKATNQSRHLDEARRVFELFKTHFFDEDTGDIIEFFNQDWTRAARNGGPAEPGHLMEWCWLLREFEAQSGTDVSDYANALYARAIQTGLNPDTGFLCDSVSANGDKSAGYRSWAQTEYIKASIAQARAGDAKAVKTAASVIDRVFETYLDTRVKGGWHDQLSKRGDVMSTVMPASTFYHWFCAVAEVSAFAEEIMADEVPKG